MLLTRFTFLAIIALLLSGCADVIHPLHIQSGLEAGHNFSAEDHNTTTTRAIAELGYVTGKNAKEFPAWDFGGTGYLAMSEDFRPGIKAIARRRFNPDTSLDLSAGPMITYDSSGLFNGFIGGVSMNWKFLTLRSEFMTWPVPAWDQGLSTPDLVNYTVHHPAGHEQVWYNGVAFNGETGLLAAVLGFVAMLALVAASEGG